MREILLLLMLPCVLAACASNSTSRDQVACLARMERHVEALRPAFASMGYTMEVHLRLDEDLLDNRGFRKSNTVLGDALSSGSIRLRPSRVCGDEGVARGVIAHEMSHVALKHMGVINTGLTLSWEPPPQQEMEADELGIRALRASRSDPRAEEFLYCRLGVCGGLPPGPGIRPGLPPPMMLPE